MPPTLITTPADRAALPAGDPAPEKLWTRDLVYGRAHSDERRGVAR